MRGERRFVWAMLAPAFVILALFYAYPTAQNLALSFTDLMAVQADELRKNYKSLVKHMGY